MKVSFLMILYLYSFI